jgi:hypothetical protein
MSVRRIGLGAGLKQRAGDRDGVGGRPLPVRFDAIGGDVMEQRRTVHRRIEAADAAGAGVHESGIATQRLPQGGEVAVDDGLDRGFEFEDTAVLRQHLDVGGERGPIEKIVRTGDGEARIVERKRRRADFVIGNELREPLDLLVEKTGVLAVEAIERGAVAGALPGEQAFRLLLI